RRDLWQYLHILRDEEQVTVIVTTHLMEEAERCDRLAILNEGKLVALGTPLELKHEIGGDVIWIEASHNAQRLAERVTARFHVSATALGNEDRGSRIRVERENGHRFIAELAEAFPGEIQSMSVSKPTLEDVFIHRTGHRFWTEKETEEFVFWSVVGSAFRRSFRSGGSAGQEDYLAYFFPDALMLIMLFASIFTLMSVIEDRKEGFLLSVLVAPVPRAAIVLGKVLGGTTLS